MATNALKYTTHEGVSKIVPLDAVRLIRPLTDDDKAKAQCSLKEKRGIDIDTDRLSVRFQEAAGSAGAAMMKQLRSRPDRGAARG